MRDNDLFRTATAGVTLRGAGALLSFATGIVLARQLGPQEFGTYSLVMAAVAFAGVVGSIGLPTLVTREVATCRARGQWAELKGVVQLAHRSVLIGVAFAVAILCGVIGYAYADRVPLLLTLLAAAIVPFLCFNLLRAAALRGLDHPILADIPELAARPAIFLALVGALAVSTVKLNAANVLSLQLVSVAAVLAIGIALWWWRVPRAVAEASAIRPAVRPWARELQPFFWLTAVQTLEGQLAIYALGYTAGSSQVGIYQVAVQLVQLVVLGLVAINLPLQARLAAAWANGDRKTAQALVSQAARLGTLGALAACAVLVPFAEFIVLLYGPEYQAAANVLRILVLAQALNAVLGPCALVLAITGKQWLVLYSFLAALAANLALNILLVPRFEAIGAAVAAAVGIAVWNVLCAWLAWQRTGMFTPFRLRTDKDENANHA